MKEAFPLRCSSAYPTVPIVPSYLAYTTCNTLSTRASPSPRQRRLPEFLTPKPFLDSFINGRARQSELALSNPGSINNYPPRGVVSSSEELGNRFSSMKKTRQPLLKMPIYKQQTGSIHMKTEYAKTSLVPKTRAILLLDVQYFRP